jgi:hypothetical protein
MSSSGEHNPKSWGNFGKVYQPQESGWEKFLHITSPISNLHKGGIVKKTGNYRLRKGERVLTVTQQKAAGLKKGGKKKAHARKRVSSKG